MTEQGKGRWIIASNRLPFSKEDGKVTVSPGGLVSALSGVRSNREMVWIGTAPDDLTASDIRHQRAGRFARFVPIHVDKDDYHAYYNGISNDVFWPAFHYESQYVNFRWEDWEAYHRVNEQFAKVILDAAKPGDLIWIHDFHLFLVPHYLRLLETHLKIGFFLHIPFPSSEIFQELPVRQEILDSLLSADLVGFHDHGYLRHFLASAQRVGRLETSVLGVRRGTRTTRVGVFPVSIDTARYKLRARAPKVLKLTETFRIAGSRSRVVLGVDRLDYSKGIDLKLRAFQDMLRNHPRLRGHVSLIQVAVPTRQGVREYRRLRSQIEMLVGAINGEFGRPNHTPAKYMYGSVSFATLLALYNLANVMIVSSKRDGMNLVCQEYVAAQDPDDPGVVLLSEFAGAISTLIHAVPINPWDTHGTAEKLAASLQTPKAQRREHHAQMLRYLEAYTASDWARDFMTALDWADMSRLGQAPDERTAQVITPRRLASKLRNRIEGRPIFLLTDYDGTLVPICDTPDDAILGTDMRQQLERLIKHDNIRVVTVSGRPGRFLSTQFRGLNLSMASEHGARFYSAGRKRWQTLVHSETKQWLGTAVELMKGRATRVPDSFIERKQYSVSWHYRKSPKEFAAEQASKLKDELEFIFANMPVTVIGGKRIIEVRASEANKGHFVRWLLHTHPLRDDEVIVAFGDDETDEEMFSALPENAITIKVGPGNTVARYRIESQRQLLPFLNRLTALQPDQAST